MNQIVIRRNIKELLRQPEYATYFADERVYVGGTIFIDNDRPLLVQQYVGKEENRTLGYKIPGGVMKHDIARSEQNYRNELRSILKRQGYSFQEIELLLRREEGFFTRRTEPERYFVLKFLSETGLMPLEFSFVHYKTHYSNKEGEKDDPHKSFLHLYFIVTKVYDAVLDQLPIKEIRALATIRQRTFVRDPDIVEPRVLHLTGAEAVQEVINRHKEAMGALLAMKQRTR